jgi:sporadic carbohydrate cluster 2OG-Fe(II) oxygenase
MAVVESFFTAEEAELSRAFMAQGYVVRDVDDRPALDTLRAEIVRLACLHLACEAPADAGEFLDTIHRRVAPEKLNDLRLFVFRALNEFAWLRPTYHALGRSLLGALVGNELAMQNRVNLSIQMSDDNSSLLDIHSDVYGGETPFQVVQWLPLVDVAGTKSMFILPQAKTREVEKELNRLGEGGMRVLFDRVKADLVWLDIPYGKVLVFDSSCLHGNVVNETPTTRWSLNCRFTGLFTPYTSYEKKLGSFYLPITTRAASRIGMRYEQPGGFRE